jgi:hypothetical protein
VETSWTLWGSVGIGAESRLALVSSLQDSPGLFIGMLVLGFLIGTFGHIYKSNFAIGIGIALVFSATVVIPGLVYFSD